MAEQSKSARPPFSHELRVRYGECDAQGIVFNANFLAYVDVVLTEIWREALGSYDALLATGVDTVVAESNLRFLAPTRFDDLLRIECGFDPLGTTSATLHLWFRREDDLLAKSTSATSSSTWRSGRRPRSPPRSAPPSNLCCSPESPRIGR